MEHTLPGEGGRLLYAAPSERLSAAPRSPPAAGEWVACGSGRVKEGRATRPEPLPTRYAEAGWGCVRACGATVR
jgi:hypothetical protein